MHSATLGCVFLQNDGLSVLQNDGLIMRFAKKTEKDPNVFGSELQSCRLGMENT